MFYHIIVKNSMSCHYIFIPHVFYHFRHKIKRSKNHIIRFYCSCYVSDYILLLQQFYAISKSTNGIQCVPIQNWNKPVSVIPVNTFHSKTQLMQHRSNFYYIGYCHILQHNQSCNILLKILLFLFQAILNFLNNP